MGVVVLLILTEAVYLPLSVLRGRETLAGMDCDAMHMRRIAFAREALFGARHTLPAWYPHELLGAPFSANLQSFPWIPTRLVLFLFDPTIAFAVGVAIAAGLAALFAFLFLRRAGLSEIGAAAAAWTFACAGYFSSRVAAGHLPLLEAYPALPLLLWLVDRALSPERVGRHRFDLGALGISSACVAVAGHPQIPAYSLAAALLYAVWRGRGWPRARALCAIALGVGATLAAWWPMFLLIGRSTRVLHLSPPDNDIVMPYGRLLSLILPGINGWAPPITLAERNEFHGFPNTAYFWDTVCYVGILPLVAIIVLFFGCLATRRLPDRRWMFLAAMGLGALLCALPLVEPVREIIPLTIFRSPVRLMYLATFSAAVALGAGVDRVLGSKLIGSGASRCVVVAVCLGLHVLDLSGLARLFIWPVSRQPQATEFQSTLDREVRDGRIAADQEMDFSYADRYDDIGGFDSIFLADSYRAILALTRAPKDLNEQQLDGSRFSAAALEATGVRFVITPETRTDLQLDGRSGGVNLYRVSNPAPRAAFFSESMTEFMPEDKILDAFVSRPRRDRLLLPAEARRDVPGVPGPGGATPVYSRISSDEIRLETTAGQAGFVQVLEAYDPGWTAEVDGVRAPVVPANGFTIAVPVPAGSHVVRLLYHTPGRTLGVVFSLLSVLSLVALVARAQASRRMKEV
jgi:hypothetical protein